jgi:hypothetical protein
MSTKTLTLAGIKLVTYYAPATSLMSATGAVITVIFMTLLISTLYVAFKVYHKNVTHFTTEQNKKDEIIVEGTTHNLKIEKPINLNDEES